MTQLLFWPYKVRSIILSVIVWSTVKFVASKKNLCLAAHLKRVLVKITAPTPLETNGNTNSICCCGSSSIWMCLIFSAIMVGITTIQGGWYVESIGVNYGKLDWVVSTVLLWILSVCLWIRLYHSRLPVQEIRWFGHETSLRLCFWEFQTTTCQFSCSRHERCWQAISRYHSLETQIIPIYKLLRGKRCQWNRGIRTCQCYKIFIDMCNI